jgi:nucleotide-binding universal stress UspA family protein
MKIRKVLLTTDFSACSTRTFLPAADLARLLEASIELVNCMEYPSQFTPGGFLDELGSMDNLRRLHRKNLELAAADPAFKGLPLTTHFVEGEGPETVRDFAQSIGADLIIQATHGLTGVKRWVLGSFAERLLRISSIPVLTFKSAEDASIVPPREFQPQRILFPYDYSAAAKAALEPLKFLAATYHAKVLVLHAWRNPAELLPIYGAEGMAVDFEMVSRNRDILGELTRALRQFAGQELGGLEHEVEAVMGDPASVILARATEWQADLVCMSTHGWTGLRKMFLGNVAEKVLRRAPCPTWVVRTPHAKLKD